MTLGQLRDAFFGAVTHPAPGRAVPVRCETCLRSWFDPACGHGIGAVIAIRWPDQEEPRP